MIQESYTIVTHTNILLFSKDSALSEIGKLYAWANLYAIKSIRQKQTGEVEVIMRQKGNQQPYVIELVFEKNADKFCQRILERIKALDFDAKIAKEEKMKITVDQVTKQAYQGVEISA